MSFTPSGLQWAYSASGDEKLTLGAKRFTKETTNTTTGSTTIPEVTANLRYAAVPRQGERPWMRQLNAPEGAVIGVPGKA